MKDWRTVAGVVSDVRENSIAQEGSERVVGDIYFPAAQGIIVPISDARIDRANRSAAGRHRN